MGFNSFHNGVQNPAENYYRWSGGLKDVESADGTTTKQLKGELTFWDGEERQVVALPFRFCALEQTRSITGFAPTNGSDGVRFYSNETVEFDDVMTVFRKDSGGTEEILRGKYSEIKDQLPQGARLQVNLYMFNPVTEQIERLNLVGSALSAFIDFSKKNKGIYEHPIIMEAGEPKKFGTVEFVPPKFSLGDAYTDEELKVLREKDEEVIEYMKNKRDQNHAQSDFGGGQVDQTPTTYQGEENQETGEVSEDDISLEEVPF